MVDAQRSRQRARDVGRGRGHDGEHVPIRAMARHGLAAAVADVDFDEAPEPVVAAGGEDRLVHPCEAAHDAGGDGRSVDDPERVLRDPVSDARRRLATSPRRSRAGSGRKGSPFPFGRACDPDRRARRAASVDSVTAPERLAEDVAERMVSDRRADSPRARAEPAEDERGEEDGEPRGGVDRREVPEREDRARDEDARADGRAGDLEPRGPDVVEP